MWHPRSIKEYRLNSVYFGGSLDTYGVDVGYSITPEFETSIGYYYQKGDLGAADGSGVQGRIAYNMGNGFSIGTNLSYDDAFDGRVSADILYRFASPKATTASINKAWNAPTIKGLSTPSAIGMCGCMIGRWHVLTRLLSHVASGVEPPPRQGYPWATTQM